MPSRTVSTSLVAVVVAALLGVEPAGQAARSVHAPRWFRGNTHTRSLNSNGKMAWTQPAFVK